MFVVSQDGMNIVEAVPTFIRPVTSVYADSQLCADEAYVTSDEWAVWGKIGTQSIKIGIFTNEAKARKVLGKIIYSITTKQAHYIIPEDKDVC